MVFQPSEFLTVAKQLIRDSKYKNQAGFRTSISRSYYAAFLVIRKKLQELGEPIGKGYEQHQVVINALMGKNSSLGNKLHSLRDKRNDADYQLHANINDALAKECAKLSSVVINSSSDMRF